MGNRARDEVAVMDRQAGKNEEGALLIVLMVGVAVMLIGVAVAVQMWSTTWRRDSEEELIFRGGQYVDAILLFRKEHNGAFPMALDELMKPGPRRLRYIRRLYRDPVNPKGQWGLLYLMPGGTGIYDPVAAQAAKQNNPNSEGGFGDMGGVTPINFNPMTGTVQPGMPGGQGVAGLPGGQGSATPGFSGPMAGGNAGGTTAGLVGGVRGPGTTVGMGGVGLGGALPPPKPASGTFDEKEPSEPPIGWPIAGVISRAMGEINDRTFRVYKGHDKVNEWQFHIFDRGGDQPQAPTGTMPGGSPSPFGVGPGYGGTPGFGLGPQGGPVGGSGYGPRINYGGNWPYGMGGGNYGQQGGGQGGQGGQGGGPRQKPNPGNPQGGGHN